MTERMAKAEFENEQKLALLKHVSRNWMEKVKADMGRTEEEQNKRLTMVTRVAKQWEAEASEQVITNRDRQTTKLSSQVPCVDRETQARGSRGPKCPERFGGCCVDPADTSAKP